MMNGTTLILNYVSWWRCSLSPSYGVYILQLIRFARVCSHVDDFNNRNTYLTFKLLKEGYGHHKLCKAFSKLYNRHSELIVKYNICFKTLLQQGISEPVFYGDLVYKLKRIVGKPNFSVQFKKIIKCYLKVGYNVDIMRQSACLFVNPITVDSYGFLFDCTTMGQAYFESGTVVQEEMSFQEIAYLELWQPLGSVEWNHFCSFCVNEAEAIPMCINNKCY